MLGLFAIVGIAAAAVLAPPSSSWRGAAEHSRGFWVAWIVGFGALGFAGPATSGLGWVPMGWFALWTTVGTLQPSMVADLVEVRRFGRRRLATPSVASVARMPIVTAMAGPQPIRWRAPAAPPVLAARGTISGG
jgi:Na+/melibiose symporter-like transporter